MTDRRIRCQVEHRNADGLHTTYALTIEPPELDPATEAQVQAIVDQLLDDLRALGITEPAATAAALLLEQIAEERAYARVAQRRGVLAL